MKTRKHRQQRSRRRTGGSGRPVRDAVRMTEKRKKEAAEAGKHRAIRELEDAYEKAGKQLEIAKAARKELERYNRRR